MDNSLNARLKLLIGKSVRISDSAAYPQDGQAKVDIHFSDGTKMQASYWRLIKNQRQLLSSFDHEQQYGLPEPINAKVDLQKALKNKTTTAATVDTTTGDLLFQFSDELSLQVFNFTGYEIWQISFPEGTVEYSNYSR